VHLDQRGSTEQRRGGCLLPKTFGVSAAKEGNPISDWRGGQSHAKLKIVEISYRTAVFLCVAVFTLSSLFVYADEKPMMKAVVAHEYGAPDVLKFEKVPRPEPNADEALVRVIASSVNPADPLTLSGKYAREFGTHLPLIPGYDIAGIVEKTGANVTKLKVGEAVYGYPNFGGGWADYVPVKEWEVAAKPKSLNFVEAAAVPMGALTAWQALVDVAKVQPGQTVLIHGGSGGVGSFAIQIAKARGARVIATASTANQDLLKQLGADVAVDYTKTKFEDVAKDVDVVLDPVGKDTLARSYALVKKGGIVMSLVAGPDPAELKKYEIRGAGISVHPDAEDFTEIAQLIDAGKIKPIVTQVLPLSEAIAAQQQAATHHTRGKVVLRIADEPKS
jgi:NADPH:quinone reductase-like Zn-dependent oxidoreductase